MHLCHESRRYTLKHLPLQVRGAGNKIFYTNRRLYRPDFDVFCTTDDENSSLLLKLMKGERRLAERNRGYSPIYRQIAHIANDVNHIGESWPDTRQTLIHWPSLRQFSIICRWPDEISGHSLRKHLLGYAPWECNHEALEALVEALGFSIWRLEVNEDSPVDPESGELLVTIALGTIEWGDKPCKSIDSSKILREWYEDPKTLERKHGIYALDETPCTCRDDGLSVCLCNKNVVAMFSGFI